MLQIQQFNGKIGKHDVSVDVNGTVHSHPVCANFFTFDEARLAAASHFLTQRGLTAADRKYWAAVKQTTKRDS